MGNFQKWLRVRPPLKGENILEGSRQPITRQYQCHTLPNNHLRRTCGLKCKIKHFQFHHMMLVWDLWKDKCQDTIIISFNDSKIIQNLNLSYEITWNNAILFLKSLESFYVIGHSFPKLYISIIVSLIGTTASHLLTYF